MQRDPGNFDRIGIKRTIAMEGRSVMPRTVMEELRTIARVSAPLVDRQAKARERIDQFKDDLENVLIKLKWTSAETEKLILDLRLRLRALTERGSTNVEESTVLRTAVDRLRGSGSQP
jgi:tRNA C32,U32 (ribose-2'-O)-methylase TrmJ